MDKHQAIIGCIFAIVPHFAIAASNFDIIPAQTVSDTIFPGEIVSAYYKITNNTDVVLANYTIQGLPSTVTQNTQSPYCPHSITLAPHASCIVQLDIAAAVKTNFALCKKDSCTAAAVPLNIFRKFGSPNMIAVGSYSTLSTGYPLLASSSDGGSHWEYQIDNNIVQSVTDYGNQDSFSPSPFSASCAEGHCVFAGSYLSTSDSNGYPVIANRLTNKSDWLYVLYSATDPSTPPPSSINSLINSVSCTGKTTCIAAGQQNTGASTGGTPPNFAPLIATSSDAGQTWGYTFDANTVRSVIPQYWDYGFVGKASASCFDNNCIVVGNYFGTTPAPFTTYPMLLSSNDKGLTWTSPINGTNISSYISNFNNGGNTFTSYEGASCFGLTCAAAGKYVTNSDSYIYPLLVLSKDGGTTWDAKITSLTPALPDDYLTFANYQVFNSVSCSGQACVAGGQYLSKSPCSLQFPLLAASTDGGNTWSYQITSNIDSEISDYADGGGFNSVSCTGLLCVAVGQYTSEDTYQYPLLATSEDGGMTWKYRITSLTNNLPANATQGVFNSVTCIGNNCVAGGRYNDGTTFVPWIAVSNDGGKTWKFTLDSQTNPSVPVGYNSDGNFTGTTMSS